MSVVLLSIHVVAAIIFVGPVSVAASLFPPVARRALADATDERAQDRSQLGVLALLHRISRAYGLGAVVVPVFGVATAIELGSMGDYWIWISMVLTAAAGLLLGARVVPGQAAVLRAARLGGSSRPETASLARGLTIATGIFSLTWAVVVVLMIARPGSTTGV